MSTGSPEGAGVDKSPMSAFFSSGSSFSNLRGDFTGGLSAALVSLPMSIGYGILAFAPLGDAFSSHGALLGVYSAIICGFFAAIFGSSPIQVTGPAGSLTLILAAVVARLSASSSVPVPPSSPWLFIVSMTALCVFTGGVVQILMGAVRFGRVARSVPYPVLSGIMNGIGLAVIVSQIHPFLGARRGVSGMDIVLHPSMIEPYALLVGMATLAVIVLVKRRYADFPAPLAGLVVGTCLYHLHHSIAPGSSSLPTLGAIEFQWPLPNKLTQLWPYLGEPWLWDSLSTILISGFVLALVGSIESLLSSTVAQDLTGGPLDGNRELLSQGVGNVVGSMFGAIAGAGSVVRTAANYSGGGRTRLSSVLCSVFLLMAVVLLTSLMEAVPLAAVAGVMMYIGLSLFDGRPVRLLRMLTDPGIERSGPFFDLMVILLVAGVTVASNMVVAVFLGVILTSFYLISQLGRNIVRRVYTGQERRSRRVRPSHQEAVLREKGNLIAVVELQGVLFFGATEQMRRKVEWALSGSSYCILDLKRVYEMDSTGARALIQAAESFNRCGKHLLLCSLDERGPLWASFRNESRFTTVVHSDADAALEWAEDRILGEVSQGFLPCSQMTLEQTGVVEGFTSAEIEVLRKRLALQRYSRGEPVFREGDAGRDLFILLRGTVTVNMRSASGDRSRRLHTLCPGSVFGEMALLDGLTRSADVWADEEVEVLRLSCDAYNGLAVEDPVLFGKLTVNLARVSTGNLRRTDAENRLME